MVVGCYANNNRKVGKLNCAIFGLLILWLSFSGQSQELNFPMATSVVHIGPQAQQLTHIGEHSLKGLNDMVQTKDGFFWFVVGTELFRYDGLHLESQRFLANQQHLITQIEALVVDADQSIWLAAKGLGLVHYLPSQKSATLYEHNPDDLNSLSTNHILSLQLDGDDTIWIGSQNGVNRFSRKNKTVERLNHQLQPVSDLAHKGKRVRQVFKDKQDRIWVSVSRHGINLISNGQVKHFKPDNENERAINLTSRWVIYQTRDDAIWIGDYYGVNRYEPQSNDFTFYPIKLSRFARSGRAFVYTMSESPQGDLYIGTQHNGLMVLPKGGSKIKPFNEDILYENTVSTAMVRKIMFDASGVLWVCDYLEGLFKVKPHAQTVQHFGVPKGWTRGFASFTTSNDGEVYLGSRDNLYRLNQQTDGFELIHEKLYNIVAMPQLPDGRMVLLRGGAQLKFFNPQTNEVTPFTNDFGEPIALPVNTHHSGAVSDDGSLWIGVFGRGGIYRLKPGAKQFTQILDKGTVETILPVGNRIYAGVRFGLLKIYDMTREQWLDVDYSHHDLGHILHIVQDKIGRIWVATRNKGLALLDPIDLTLNFIGVEQGLGSKDVRAIVPVSDSKLWLTTSKGLSMVSFDGQGLSNVTIDNFNTQHGLRNAAYIPEMAVVDKNGHLWVGEALTLSRINTHAWLDALKSPVKTGVLLSDFRLFNRPVSLQSASSPISKPVNQVEKLELTHEQSWFSIAFAAADQRITDKARYAYRLEGFNRDWVETNRLNAMATFTSLPADDYLLKIKTTDVDGRWQEDYRTLPITVHPPWWQTTWAYSLYALAIFMAVYGVFVYRTRALRVRANALEQGVIERTATINQLVGQKDRLIEQKDKMFANISHEFKTPLTLILNPLDTIEIDKASSTAARHVQMMKRNGQRLLRMVEQLLELSKLETTDVDERRYYSLAQTLDMLLISFQPLFDSKSLTLKTTDFDEVVLSMKVDSLDMILTNLISNAIKYTPENGAITIEVTQLTDMVSIAISDTGIGIDEQNQEIVFNRFTRANETHNENIPGAGIGLALVKELVESHQGTIDLQSQLGAGSTFSIELPIAVVDAKKVADISGISSTSQNEIDALSMTDQQMPSTGRATEHGSSKPSLLLIDDNADMLSLLQDALSPHFDCLLEQNGEDGVKSAIVQLPDLIISDVMMPGISGFEVLQQLKTHELTCHIPVVLLTARGDIQSRMQGWANNADEYLEKPFNSAELLLRIDSLLSVRALLRHRYQREFTNNKLAVVNAAQIESETAVDEPQTGLNAVNQAFVERINTVLDKHFQDEDLDVGFLASEMAMSHRQLGRKMKSILDLTPAETIRSFRLKKAAELLLDGHNAGVVAFDVGFTSHSYFSQCFKAQYNCLPSAYAEQAA